MRFVDHYLLYFTQQLITGLLLVLLPFQPLFTESSRGDQLLASPPPFPGVLSAFLSPLLFASFQFIVYSVSFCRGVVSLPRGLCWFISGVTGGILSDAWCSPVWSAKFFQAGLELEPGGDSNPLVFSVYHGMEKPSTG
jgi:hypothetical protein